jgi:hypothetical protein
LSCFFIWLVNSSFCVAPISTLSLVLLGKSLKHEIVLLLLKVWWWFRLGIFSKNEHAEKECKILIFTYEISKPIFLKTFHANKNI